LCVGIVAIRGVPAPHRLSASWWLLRPVWIVAVLGMCAVLIGATAAVRAKIRPRAAKAGVKPAPVLRLALGAVIAAVGGAVIGLYGPATVPRALICCTLLGAGWLLLRSAEP
jgi:hypothetical protein